MCVPLASVEYIAGKMATRVLGMVVEGTNVGSKRSSSKSPHQKHTFGGFDGQLGGSGMILVPPLKWASEFSQNGTPNR